MKRYKIIISLAAIICGLMIACDNTDYSNKAPFNNMVYIKEASNSNSERVTFRNTLNEQKRAFSAKLTYPAGKDIVVKLKADPGLINEFNARHGTDYGMLDSKYYSLSNSELIIKAEKSESLIDTIYFNNLLDLEIDNTYLVPLTISETSGGVHLLNGSKTLFYLVRRSSAITVAANLKDNYLEVPTFLDEEKNACLKELGQITMEALIYVEDFTYSGPSNTAGASDISTIMGVEQHFLMRIGDTSFPRQQLQMQGPDGVKFPAADRAKSLNAMTWYHIALVYNAKEHFIAYYVNGQLQSQDISYGKGATVDICGTPDCEFQIGRSYEDELRQLNGNIAEIRIWNTCRTKEEIWTNMYKVEDPENEESLLAYWKFNEGEGNIVKDHSKHGFDAVSAEPLVWPTGIEIPQINK